MVTRSEQATAAGRSAEARSAGRLLLTVGTYTLPLLIALLPFTRLWPPVLKLLAGMVWAG
jgi:hypothetical protein